MEAQSFLAAKPFPEVTSGKFKIEHMKSISRLLTDERSSFVRPDCFDTQGNWYRLLHNCCGLIAIKVNNSGAISWSSSVNHNSANVKRIVKKLVIPINLPEDATIHLPKALALVFKKFAPLVHISSASLEEALFKSIIRQVITAKQAKKTIHRFITEFGKCYEYEGIKCYCFPSSSDIVDISTERLISCGLGFKANRIKNLAERILEDGLQLSSSNTDNINILMQLKGIGEWSARSSLCDFTGDWSVYPVDDLAVRTWAYKMWPEYQWSKNPKEFQYEWNSINGQYASQITFYLLTVASLMV